MPLFTSDELRMLRAFRNMKQREVAKKMNISTQRYSQLVNHGDLSDEQVRRMLQALGYTAKTARFFLDNLRPPPPRE